MSGEYEVIPLQLGLVIRPGDHILVTLTDWTPPELLDAWKRRLGDTFPGVEFSIAAGVSGLARIEQGADHE